MQVISLFSGGGGFELSAEYAGWDNIVSCEINEFCQTLLKYYWPDSYHHSDIKTLSYEIIKKESRYKDWQPTIVVGCFPCQPFSTAGEGKGTEDPRHLWPEMHRIIQEVEPDFVVGENVRGLVSWNDGMVFEQICSDLETLGFETWPYLLPACGKDAPHKRHRIFFIAYSSRNGHKRRKLREDRLKEDQGGSEENKWKRLWRIVRGAGQSGIVTYAPSIGGLQTSRGEQSQQPKQFDKGRQIVANPGSTELKGSAFAGGGDGGEQGGESNPSGLFRPNWDEFPTQSPVCSGNDGLPSKLDGITFPTWRAESIKIYGNAIVVPLVTDLFQTINLFIQKINEKPNTDREWREE